MSKIGSEFVLAIALGLYCFYAFPTAYSVGTMVVAAVAFIMTKSLKAVVGVFIGSILLRLLNGLLAPKTVIMAVKGVPPPSMYNGMMEGFQSKDPISVHQRIASQKGAAPLSPKVPVITGVLESPHILDSLQVSEVLPPEQGAAMKTVPSSVAGPDSIPTPSEYSSPDKVMKPPPVALLPNGPDNSAVVTALATKGTSLFGGHPSSEVKGTTVGFGTIQ
jgi:hypothetical protein